VESPLCAARQLVPFLPAALQGDYHSAWSGCCTLRATGHHLSVTFCSRQHFTAHCEQLVTTSLSHSVADNTLRHIASNWSPLVCHILQQTTLYGTLRATGHHSSVTFAYNTLRHIASNWSPLVCHILQQTTLYCTLRANGHHLSVTYNTLRHILSNWSPLVCHIL